MSSRLSRSFFAELSAGKVDAGRLKLLDQQVAQGKSRWVAQAEAGEALGHQAYRLLSEGHAQSLGALHGTFDEVALILLREVEDGRLVGLQSSLQPGQGQVNIAALTVASSRRAASSRSFTLPPPRSPSSD